MELEAILKSATAAFLEALSTTAKYLKVATSTVCATSSPFDLLPHLEPLQPPPSPPDCF